MRCPDEARADAERGGRYANYQRRTPCAPRAGGPAVLACGCHRRYVRRHWTREELEAHLAHLHANRRAAFIQMTVRVDAVAMMRFITSNIAFQHALIQLAESCANGQLVSEQLASELANFCARVRFAWW